jgi:serine phosphatase RsbU (regulator of sigma subunit)
VLNSRDISDRKREEQARRQKEYAAMKAEAMREQAEHERREIEMREAKLQEAYTIIEHKNEEITDSINYAFRIQTALLPNIDTVKEQLPNSFVFWRPKDIVSGDFYWFAQRGSRILIAAADCTGHGVPGAFMTMIGNTLLNRIVLELGVVEPHEILNQLHLGVRKSLKQDVSQSRDGMDIVFAAIDQEKKKLWFAAANNPLIRIRGGEVEEFKADKYSIGGLQTESERKFTGHELDIQPGDKYYLYSDGFQDQFGGENGRKYMTKRFKQYLTTIAPKPVEVQRDLLDKEITTWMGTKYEQLDDVLVIGVTF